MFNSTGPHFCPKCKPIINRYGKRIGGFLKLTEDNYSGSGEDMVNCTECGKGFAISYKVDKIVRAPTWDVDPNEQG